MSSAHVGLTTTSDGRPLPEDLTNWGWLMERPGGWDWLSCELKLRLVALVGSWLSSTRVLAGRRSEQPLSHRRPLPGEINFCYSYTGSAPLAESDIGLSFLLQWIVRNGHKSDFPSGDGQNLDFQRGFRIMWHQDQYRINHHSKFLLS